MKLKNGIVALATAFTMITVTAAGLGIPSAIAVDDATAQSTEATPFAVDDSIPELNEVIGESDGPMAAQVNKTISQFNTWVNANVGTCFNNHGGSQCVALFNAYNETFLGNSFIGVSYARQLYDAAPTSKWTKFTSGTPKKGDVAIWGASVGGGAGHVAIVLENMTTTTIRVFHQNWNGACAHKETVSKSGIIGYLRPKNLS